jgi:excisionase family DNA binding protein
VPDLIPVNEAARLLGVTSQWLGALIRNGEIRAYRGSRRRYLLDRSDVTDYLRKHPSDRNPIPVKGAK